MSLTAFTGPLVTFGQGGGADNNPEIGTSLFFAGSGILDPRPQFTYLPGQTFGSPTYGWLGTQNITSLYANPMTLTATKLTGAGTHVVAGVPMTLIASTTTGVATGVSAIRRDTGAIVNNLLMLDPLTFSATASITVGSNILTVTATTGATGFNLRGITIGSVLTDVTTAANIPAGTTIVDFLTGNGGIGTYVMSANATATAATDNVTGIFTGLPCVIPIGQPATQTLSMYHPGGMIARAVRIVSTTSQLDKMNFTINGLDVYGFPMTEVLQTSGTGAATLTGAKAWKCILSVTSDTTDGTGNYSVGTTDIIGLPIRSDQFQIGGMPLDTQLMMNNAAIASGTGYVSAVKTTATATTGDVRGTYALQTASNGVLQVAAVQSPTVTALQSAVGLYGVPQFSAW